jgi:hypothetical protein
MTRKRHSARLYAYQWVAETPKKDRTYIWLISKNKSMYQSDDLARLAMSRLFSFMTNQLR